MITPLRRTAVFFALASILLVSGLSRPVVGVAAVVPWGNVLVPGAQWAGAAAQFGDLNVYSNGDGNQDQTGYYGNQYECVELAARWAGVRFGEQRYWNISYAYQMWDAAPHLSVPFRQLVNGGTTAPQFGDILVFNKTSTNATGHVAVVADVSLSGGYVDIVEQNYNNASPTGRARLPITVNSNGTYTMAARYGLPIIGWIRSSTAPAGMTGVTGPGGYTVDGYGGVHAYGSAVPTTTGAYWPGWNIVRGIARSSTGDSGYTVDGYGGVHPFGGAPAVKITGYWPGRDIVRGITLRPDGVSGFVLDAYGGLHPFAAATVAMPATPMVSAYWSGWDIARDVALKPGSTSAGWTLDGWGGVHPFGGAPALSGGPYWKGWDIARGLAANQGGSGAYILDGYNGIHALGGAPARTTSAYFPGQDVARGIVITDQYGGYTVTAWGRVRPFGTEPEVTYQTWGDPVAKGMS